jgi:hypothetical protein
LELVPGHRVWPILRVTLRPQGGLPMIVRHRAGTDGEISGATHTALKQAQLARR